MRTSNSVLIKGDAAKVYQYAAEIERWPEILPHYRDVSVLEPGDRERVVRMHCVRRFGPIAWPCRWRARQGLMPEERRIRYWHLAGPAKGMFVEWTLEEKPEGVLTTIFHEMNRPLPIVGNVYTDRIVGPLFVHAIAGQTLQTIKHLVESGGEQ